MQRILIIGSGGSGKSTLSAALGQRLALPVIHMDALYWQPGWVEPAKPDWQARVEALCLGERWVMDGNYSGTLAQRLAACDTVIFLDLPPLLCLWRALRRGFRYRGQVRPDMAEGCPEQLPDPAFLSWIWNYPTRSRPKVMALLDAHRQGRRIVHLRSRREVGEFLHTLGQTTDTTAAASSHTTL
ncbi:Adenylate kinase [Pseudomonas delhiensis]|uniref:Adenylate kinase n=1 Tax=Pseudomonas delhiensis TaxID=366289 RepID=A0A239IKY0_9PSED|nr:topology modulation protein [Pseudomonas delhiensis]SDI63997.1 Adenylate kinase [Pseudomonas delhiensis]SNS94225.1 Adenylate kinase [Pseudomonas delhiensis]